MWETCYYVYEITIKVFTITAIVQEDWKEIYHYHIGILNQEDFIEL